MADRQVRPRPSRDIALTVTWAEGSERGLVRISTVTRLEIGLSACTENELREGLRTPLRTSMPVEYLTPAIEDRAVALQALLADRGHHRVPAVPDLLIATADLAVLQLDKDFELIAKVTGQQIERLSILNSSTTASPGSLSLRLAHSRDARLACPMGTGSR